MRKFLRNLATAASIALIPAAAVYAQTPSDTPRNEIELRGTISIPSGDASFAGTTSGGTDIDFKKDFDFANRLGFDGRYTYRTENKKHKFFVEWGTTHWSRSTSLSRTIIIRDQVFTANLQTHATLRLNVFRAMYSRRWGTDKFRIGPMVDMGVITTRVGLSAVTNTSSLNAENSISRFFATIGYDLDWDPTEKVNVFSNTGAIVFQGEHFFHTDNGVRYYLTRHWGVDGGYKFERDKVHDGNGSDHITIRAHGPFFGGLYRF